MSNDANKLKQRQEIRKYMVFAGMFLLFIGCIWLIFAPSKKDRQEKEKSAGFNSELPDPRGVGIEADKIAAYEQADMKRRQAEKLRTLEDFSALADGHGQDKTVGTVVEISPDKEPESGGTSYRGSGSGRREVFSSSTSAYNDINATLGNFYQQPVEDPEKEALKAEVEQLRQEAARQQPAQMTYDDQVALLEKSYELAARYMPGDGAAKKEEGETNNRKAKAIPVGQVSTPVVSSLPQPASDSVLLARLVRGGNSGFHTAVGKTADGHTRNTIRACVHGDQTVTSGRSVRLRLLEPMRVGKYILPHNSLVTGEGRIQGERLGIGIVQVEHDGTIIPWSLPCMITTGRKASSFPARWRRMPLRRVAANLGTKPRYEHIHHQPVRRPTSCCPNSARGAIQGVSQYISRKMREERYTSSPAIP